MLWLLKSVKGNYSDNDLIHSTSELSKKEKEELGNLEDIDRIIRVNKGDDKYDFYVIFKWETLEDVEAELIRIYDNEGITQFIRKDSNIDYEVISSEHAPNDLYLFEGEDENGEPLRATVNPKYRNEYIYPAPDTVIEY